ADLRYLPAAGDDSDAGGHVAGRLDEARRVETQVRQQLAALAVLDVFVGYAQPPNVRRRKAGLARGLQHGAAEAAHQGALFDREHEGARLDGTQNRFRIERLDEAGVDHADVEPLFAQGGGGLDATAQQRAAGD